MRGVVIVVCERPRTVALPAGVQTLVFELGAEETVELLRRVKPIALGFRHFERAYPYVTFRTYDCMLDIEHHGREVTEV